MSTGELQCLVVPIVLALLIYAFFKYEALQERDKERSFQIEMARHKQRQLEIQLQQERMPVPVRSTAPTVPPVEDQVVAREKKLRAELDIATKFQGDIFTLQKGADENMVNLYVEHDLLLKKYEDNPVLHAKFKSRFEKTEGKMDDVTMDLLAAFIEIQGTTANDPFYSAQIAEDILRLMRLAEEHRRKALSKEQGARQ